MFITSFYRYDWPVTASTWPEAGHARLVISYTEPPPARWRMPPVRKDRKRGAK